jgi:hypothetical protein
MDHVDFLIHRVYDTVELLTDDVSEYPIAQGPGFVRRTDNGKATRPKNAIHVFQRLLPFKHAKRMSRDADGDTQNWNFKRCVRSYTHL